jgi:hypothetical protein
VVLDHRGNGPALSVEQNVPPALETGPDIGLGRLAEHVGLEWMAQPARLESS